MRKISLMFMTLVTLTAHAEIYKWVDENGVTHYDMEEPTDNNAQQMSVKQPAVATPGSSTATESAELASGVLRDKGDADTLDCRKAVANAQDSIDTMLTVGEKNYKGGYIKENEYREVSRGLKQMQQKISISECQTAQGNVKGFYMCMSNDYNHVATCGKKYKYGE